MTKEEVTRRQDSVRELAAAFPGVDADTLQLQLYRLALKAARNAAAICSGENAVDQRDKIRDQIDRVAKQHGIKLDAVVSGDPRGFALSLHLPTGRSNSFGGEVWGIA